MKIRPSKHSDLRTFRNFWDSALAYQQARQFPLWPPFPEKQIENEIEAGLHFSSAFPGGVLAGYFSVALSDELIWPREERGDAIYIHRMCANPLRKGSNLAQLVLWWSREYASSLGRKFVRMDTWADNQRLVSYYIDCGFDYIGDRQLGAVPGLPPHYSNIKLSLFQNTVDCGRYSSGREVAS